MTAAPSPPDSGSRSGTSPSSPSPRGDRTRRWGQPFPRARAVHLHDLAMAAASLPLAMGLRLGDGMLAHTPPLDLALSTLVFTACAGLAFRSQHLDRGIWRYVSLEDLIALLRAATLAVGLFLLASFLITRLESIPRSVPVIQWFVLLALLGGPRFLYRLAKDGSLSLTGLDLRRAVRRRRAGSPSPGTGTPGATAGDTIPSSREIGAIPALLVGAGDGCELFLRSLARDLDPPYAPLGILAEREGRVGRRIRGLEVMGTLEDLAEVVAGLQARGQPPRKLILTKDDLNRATLAELLETGERLGLTLARLPRLTDLKSGHADSLELRPIALDDLLGRPQAVLDRRPVVDLVRGQTVLVTGAGGSIGAELVRQIADLDPARLILADHGEHALYSIDLEMGERCPALPRRAVLLDVRQPAAVDSLLAAERPTLVFHAAALKHVPLVELNPLEGLATNALGTRVVADACHRHGVRVMVLISTDKAVNPTNVMGASKRLAESWCQALDLAAADRPGCRFVTVRFGNVLGSTGSVVPLFQRQLARGGPLTVTHPEITRYFMTIREAVELVLQAAALGSQAKAYRGAIFVLDMGPPVRIADLARQMIRLAGLRPGVDVPIVYTGLRPGEKLYEELFHGAEAPLPTPTQGVLVARPRIQDPADMARQMTRLETACATGDEAAARAVLAALVPELQASPTPKAQEAQEAQKGQETPEEQAPPTPTTQPPPAPEPAGPQAKGGCHPRSPVL